MGKTCVQWKETENGRRCAKFEGQKAAAAQAWDTLDHDAFGDLGDFAGELSPVGKAVLATDVLIGAAIGAGGSVLAAKGLKFLPASITGNATFNAYMPVFLGMSAAAGIYFLERSRSPRTAYGHALGADVGSALPFVFGKAMAMIPGMHDLVEVNLGRHGYGLHIDDQLRGYGMMIDDRTNSYGDREQQLLSMGNDQLLSGNSSFAEMAALSMGPDMDGLDDLVEVAV